MAAPRNLSLLGAGIVTFVCLFFFLYYQYMLADIKVNKLRSQNDVLIAKEYKILRELESAKQELRDSTTYIERQKEDKSVLDAKLKFLVAEKSDFQSKLLKLEQERSDLSGQIENLRDSHKKSEEITREKNVLNEKLDVLERQKQSILEKYDFLQKRSAELESQILHAEQNGGAEVEPDDPSLSDDVTFVFGIINMNRRAHLGIKNYTFENDYVAHLKEIMMTFKTEKMVIIVEQKYNSHFTETLEEIEKFNGRKTIMIKNVEVEDLRTWEYYHMIERIRNSDWWKASTGWLEGSPQGYSDLYNPIVMNKMLWLREIAQENPFKSKYLMWLDSGGICTPSIDHGGLSLANFRDKAKYFMNKGFLVTITAYPQSHEIHGCHRTTMYPLTRGLAPAFVTKGWILGGKINRVIKTANLYEKLLNETLWMGCLGTEETVLTIQMYREPDLFHIYFNGGKRSPFDSGDFCAFLHNDLNYKDPVEPEKQVWVRNQVKSEKMKNVGKEDAKRAAKQALQNF